MASVNTIAEPAAAAEAVPVSEITGYHAHIYFSSHAEAERAMRLRRLIAERFSVQIGGWHDRPVGPHPWPMYQVAFDVPTFATFVPWLMVNRTGLVILVHPNTDNPKADHLVNSLWLGGRLPLYTDYMQESLKAAGRVRERVVPNTQPHIAP